MVHNSILEQRSAGILLHPTSLPGPHGTGDLGDEARRFVDFVAQAGLSWWQMLPVNPPAAASADCPYAALSAFAGHGSLLGVEALGATSVSKAAPRDPAVLDSALSWRTKEPIIRDAAARPPAKADAKSLDRFRAENASWLDDYALFSALKRAHRGVEWTGWPAPLRRRDPKALAAARTELAGEIAFHVYTQWLFDLQWSELRAYANARGVRLMGDLPIFVAFDSADVWARPEIFRLAKDGRPRVVTGVPPDYFSEDGQLWGNPHYDWGALAKVGYDWWIDRFRVLFRRFDAVRVDHFIGFHRAWEVKGDARTAKEGKWAKGPRDAFFEAVKKALGDVAIVAEDLGAVTPEVFALRERFGFPGMHVLQFGFNEDGNPNEHTPHNHARNAVVYTGTHDNDTASGWFQHLPKGSKAYLQDYMGIQLGKDVHRDLIRLAWSSVANLAIAPAQDVLGLGSKARMNTPGVPAGNWSWRMKKGALKPAHARQLRELGAIYGRGARA